MAPPCCCPDRRCWPGGWRRRCRCGARWCSRPASSRIRGKPEMRLTRRGLLAAPLLATPARAQPRWPSRPVRFVVPFAPGGPVEVPARLIADHLTPRLGQPVVVDLKPGAAGAIGCREVAHATDGHTFLFMTGGIAVLPALQRNPGFDLFQDIVPISLVADTPMAIVVRADSPIRDAADMVARARAKPGGISYGSSGNGSTTHLAWLLLQMRGALECLHVPYRGAGQAVNGLYTGEIDVYMGDLGLLLPHVRDGKFRLLAVTPEARVPLVPEAPAVAEVIPG
ncbi:MAG: tripartite tricarboxylate transporter substrate binding protein, partial [Acetobacteraceae bacterium]